MALNARFQMVLAQAPVLAGQIAAKGWYVFFYNLYLAATEGLPQPEQAIEVTASPFVYTAVIRGQAHISGGTVSAVEFSRDGTTWYNAGITAGFIDMDARDQIRVTYSVLPTLIFFPM